MIILRDILINIILLFGLVFIISLTNSKIKLKNRLFDFIFGIVIGLITIFIMINAWQMATGVFFDTRTVMISVTALFFSPITSFIATLVAIAYRIYIGGPGVYAGVLSLITALGVGWVWKNYIQNKLKIHKYLQYYLFGILVHIFMLISQLAIPYPQNFEVIKNIGLIVLIFYPIATMILCIAIVNHEKSVTANILIEKSEKKYRSLIDNSKLGIIQFNSEGVIEIANQAFVSILDAKKSDLINLDMLKLPNKQLVLRVKESLSGQISLYEGYYESSLTGKVFPTRVQFSPIFQEDKVIGGIGVVEDLTEQFKNQQQIRELTQLDNLTKLYNRASFDTFILNPDNMKELPIAIATFDINTFQIINTSFGYDVGNQVLVEIANQIKNITDDLDDVIPYRIGGDEFALIFTSANLDQANKITEKVKEQINQIDLFDFNVNMSYGIDYISDKGKSISETYNQALINMNSNKIYDGSSISIKTIDVIMATLFEKSKREKMHSERVSVIAREIAKLYELGTAFTNRVELAGRLHDIGKINIAEEILDKPARLNESERKKINKHPESGFRILSSVPEYLDIANIVLSHHERFDGLGYPKGVKGHNIPLESRIIAVADAFDAMTEQRTYRIPLTIEEAIEELKSNKASQFDPEVVDKFIIYMINNDINY
ncbi:MAG: HD domain-containing phosphohydrolase [Candidatus Izemoplasmatales bacterium]